MAYRKRDTQRSKVYAWENEQFDARDRVEVVFKADGAECVKSDGPAMMTLAEIRKVVTRVARDYGLTKRKVGVGDGRARRRACYDPNTREIKMPRWSRKQWVVLHELAHWIEFVQCPERAAWHGRQFVGIYMELLRRYDGRDLADMQRTANAARIDFQSNEVSTARWLKRHGLRQS